MHYSVSPLTQSSQKHLCTKQATLKSTTKLHQSFTNYNDYSFDVVQNDTQITPYIRLYKFTKRVKKSVRKRQMFLYHKSEEA